MEFVIRSPQVRAAAVEHVRHIKADPLMVVSVKPYTATRTIQQNRAYWGVWLREIEEATGIPAKAWHEHFKVLFLPCEAFEIDGKRVEVHETTTTLSTKAFGEYMDKIALYALESWGLIMPELPN